MSTSPRPDAFAPARARWRAMPPRERLLVAVAVAIVGAALVWWIALGPALRTLGGAAAQHRALDAQLASLRQLQAQAQALKAEPRQAQAEALRALETLTRDQLGAGARLVAAGDRATATLKAVPPDALARWLAQIRVNAHALPTEAKLNRDANGLWEGSVVLGLPPR